MLVEEITHRDPAEVINSYVGDYQGRPEHVQRAYDILMKNPKFVYEGDMYRVLIYGTEVFKNISDTRMLLAKLQRYEQKHKDPIQSWSKTIEGMREALYVNAESGLYDDTADLNVGVVFKQTHRGLDVVPVLETLPDLSVVYMSTHHAEQEVLATMRNVEIYGFFDQGGIHQDFRKFLQRIQRYRDQRNK